MNEANVTEVVFARGDAWWPRVIRRDGRLQLEIAGGADALHQPRTFRLPLTEEHAAVIRDDLARHLLLWSALLPLCDAAGVRGPLKERAATSLLDRVLLREPSEVEAMFREIRWDRGQLVAQGADIALLEKGRLFDALRSARVEPDWARMRDYLARRRTPA